MSNWIWTKSQAGLERARRIVDLRDAGWTFQAIADEFHISYYQARKIYWQASSPKGQAIFQ